MTLLERLGLARRGESSNRLQQEPETMARRALDPALRSTRLGATVSAPEQQPPPRQSDANNRAEGGAKVDTWEGFFDESGGRDGANQSSD
ncbi:hypothetical protein CDD81_3437 [Ophiocordyceps australis]|uniref:Uncharacterized protein n=1 Tax=Ophiocordyceps australis TaxID=1399860 RepID=A0A2C5XAQ4_9HYPO|nr:hypothetical protein CDD81_3437 [Ophiocordyceps australis]